MFPEVLLFSPRRRQSRAGPRRRPVTTCPWGGVGAEGRARVGRVSGRSESCADMDLVRVRVAQGRMLSTLPTPLNVNPFDSESLQWYDGFRCRLNPNLNSE